MAEQILLGAVILGMVGMAGLLSDRGGILNIGLEGMIAAGAFSAVAAARLAAAAGGSPAVATAAAFASALFAAALLGAVFVGAVTHLAANPFLVGLATNLLATGAIPIVSERLFNARGVVAANTVPLPISVAIIGGGLVIAAVAALLHVTVFGLRLRVAGEAPEWAATVGIHPDRLRGQAILGSAIVAALAGAVLALQLDVYLPGIASGRGWIGLAIVYLGFRRSPGVVAAALFFGIVDAVAVRAQAVSALPPTVVLALPYLTTIVGYAIAQSIESAHSIQNPVDPRAKSRRT